MDSSKREKQLIDEQLRKIRHRSYPLKITPDDKIVILADGDEGLSVEEIVRISHMYSIDR